VNSEITGWRHGGRSKGRLFAERSGEIDRRSGAPPVKLSLGREGLAVVFDVCLGRFRSVVHCMLLVSAS